MKITDAMVIAARNSLIGDLGGELEMLMREWEDAARNALIRALGVAEPQPTEEER